MWFGCCAYADDLCLMASNRDVLQKMVTICQDYGYEHNLVFSTDPDPKKSKTKCVNYSTYKQQCPVILDGKPLPWVDRVEHLGHIFQSNGSMEADACRARASFMSRADDNLLDSQPHQALYNAMFVMDPD